MFKIPSFPFKKLGICLSAVLGMCLWTENALAQNEQEKVEVENIRNIDKQSLEDHSSSQDAVSPKISNPRQSFPIVKSTAVRKDSMTSGEGKKVEPTTAPSTLSFNIFLYIVDKFKAD